MDYEWFKRERVDLQSTTEAVIVDSQLLLKQIVRTLHSMQWDLEEMSLILFLHLAAAKHKVKRGVHLLSINFQENQKKCCSLAARVLQVELARWVGDTVTV